MAAKTVRRKKPSELEQLRAKAAKALRISEKEAELRALRELLASLPAAPERKHAPQAATPSPLPQRLYLLLDGRVVGPEGLIGPPQRGASMAYALDTVPCASAVELGRGVDALVHEATYEDARAALAHERGHSTGVEAARIAAEAEASALVLTHFSPSVDGTALADEARALHPRIVAAQDLAEIPL